MNLRTTTDPTGRGRRERLAELRRRIAAGGPEAAGEAILRRRLLAAADELANRFAAGAGAFLGSQVLWALLHLAPLLLDGPRHRAAVAADLYPHPELLDGRETAGRWRSFLAAVDPAAPVAKHCRLLALALETVEELSRFRHPRGSSEVVAECLDVLDASAGFLESTVEAGR